MIYFRYFLLFILLYLFCDWFFFPPRISLETKISNCKQSLLGIRNSVEKYNKSHKKALNNLNQLSPFYIKKTILDPWGNQFIIDTREEIILSCGKDRIPKTKDDIIMKYNE